MSEKIIKANRWMLQNLFWMVPLLFGLIIFGIASGVYQRHQTLENQKEMKRDISTQLQNDFLLKKKQDSALRNTNELRELLKIK